MSRTSANLLTFILNTVKTLIAETILLGIYSNHSQYHHSLVLFACNYYKCCILYEDNIKR